MMDRMTGQQTIRISGGRQAVGALIVAAALAFGGGAGAREGIHWPAPHLPASDVKVAEGIVALMTPKKGARLPDTAFDQAWGRLGRIGDLRIGQAMRWYLLQHRESQAAFADIAGYVLEAPKALSSRRLRRFAELSVKPDSPAAVVAEFFSAFAPRTIRGWQIYLAALKQTGAEDRIPARARSAWVGQLMNRAGQRAFLELAGTHLTAAHHVARLNMLLRRRRGLSRAQDLLGLVKLPAADRQRFGLRIRMQANRGRRPEPSLETILAALPETAWQDRDFLWEVVRFRRRQEAYDKAIALLDRLSETAGRLQHPRRWLVERTIIALDLEKAGEGEKAYRVLAGHRQPEGRGRARAEFLAGFVALRGLKDGARALLHFQAIYTTARFSLSRARGAWWAAEAYEALKEPGLARHWRQIAAGYPLTFYGQLALRALGRPLVLPPDAPVDPVVPKVMSGSQTVVAAWLFRKLDLPGATRAMLWDATYAVRERQRRLALAWLARRLGHPSLAVRLGGWAMLRRHYAIGAGYPTVDHPAHPKVERALVLGVIRQESEFYAAARSFANARGLMQLIPGTGRQMARQAKLPWRLSRLTEDPAYNVALGSRYLDYLLRRFDGSYVLAIPAYNAGPGRVSGWVRRSPDPRDPKVDLIDWIERIPISETRNYVERVLANLTVYRALAGQVGLPSDLRVAWRSPYHPPPPKQVAPRHPDPANRP